MNTRLALLGILLAAAPVVGAAVVIDIGGFDPADEQSPAVSQIFTDFPTFDSMAIDDFTVSSAELRVTNVTAIIRAGAGFGAFENVLGYRLSVFSELSAAGASLFGDVASAFISPGGDATVLPFVTDEHGLVSLDVEIALPTAGTYWVGISPVSALTVTGQFFVHNSPSTDPGNPGNAHFANPAGGFEVGPLTDIDADLAMVVTAVPEPSACVLLLLGALALAPRRRLANFS